MRRKCWILITLLAALAYSGTLSAYATARDALTSKQLLGEVPLMSTVAMEAFAPPLAPDAPRHRFLGLLVSGLQEGNQLVLRDNFGLDGDKRHYFPAFELALVQDGDRLLPLLRGPQGRHPNWRLVVLPGRVWQENDDRGYSRASLPFALQENGQNCTHNGVMTFLFKNDGSVSKLAYQISSETCHYYQVDMWGLLEVEYQPGTFPGAENTVIAFRQEMSSRMPSLPLAQLTDSFPDSNPARFANSTAIKPQDVSTYGFVINGVNYLGECPTRHGPYPFCDMLLLPSYSLAKSLYIGLGLMYLEQHWVGARQLKVTELVPECASNGNWELVTLEHLADMTTGNYHSAGYERDESSQYFRAFQAVESHREKIELACKQYPRRAEPGSRWVYHSSDSYIAATAFDNYLSSQTGREADFFEDILLEVLWRPLKLSPSSEYPLRTPDKASRIHGYNGFSYLADDIAKLTTYLDSGNGFIQGNRVLHPALLSAALQRNELDQGISTGKDNYRYRLGFWGVSTGLCEEEVRYPFLSGYGGITVALFPNGSAYYMFSDGQTFDWLEPAKAADDIRSFCADTTAQESASPN